MFGLNCRECGRRPGGAYLTAYQIALKHGFKGTEAQWIRSIGTMRSIHVTEESGGTFECDASLGQVLQMMEDGFIPVLITVEGLPAFLSDVTGEVLSFSTSLIRDIAGDYYDCYSMSGREYTVQKMTVSGSEGGGGSIGPGSITFSMLNERLQEAVQSAESAVQPEALFTIKGYASMAAYLVDSENVEVGDFVLITESGAAKMYKKIETQEVTDPELALVYSFPASSGTDVINLARNGIGYAVSTTQGGTVPKTATLTDYVMRVNGLVAVKFNTPVEAGATLNINNTYAVPIYHRNQAIAAGVISYGNTALFVFDGTNYNLLCVDSANKNYGTANAGKPLVVGEDGEGTVGNWPVPGEGGEPVTWADIVPPNGILQTDIAKLTVEFTENQQQGGYNASANLTAVLTALAGHKAVGCKLGDYYGELIYAHADENEPGNEFAIFKVVEQVVTYQGQDGEERLPQVRMFYMTHVGVTYQVNAIGGACYVYVTETDGVYDVDTVNTAKTAQSIQGLLTAFYAGIETRMIVVDGYYRWSHPVSYHYGSAEIRFAGPEAVTVNGRTEIRMVEYTINSSSHVGRTVGATLPVPASGEPLNPSADKGKTPEVDEYGRYVLVNGGMKISAPGSGYSGKVLKASGADSASWVTVREVPEGASGDNGKYLKNVNGTPTWSTATSGSGTAVPEPSAGTQAEPSADQDKMLVVNGLGEYELSGGQTYLLDPETSGTYAGMAKIEKTFAQLLAEIQSRTPPRFYCSADGLAVEVKPVAVNQTGSTIFLSGLWGSKEAWIMLSYIGQAMRGIVNVVDVRDPDEASVSPVSGTSTEFSVSLTKNKIYRIPDGNTKVTITSVPTTGTSVIIFTTPSTIPDGYFTKPSAMKMPADWEGVEASTRYEINVMDGYALVDARAVS